MIPPERSREITRALHCLLDMTPEEWQTLNTDQRFYTGIILGTWMRWYNEDHQPPRKRKKPFTREPIGTPREGGTAGPKVDENTKE